MARKKKATTRRKSRNPARAAPEQLEKYRPDSYVGTILAPKSLTPIAVYVSSDGFRGFSPDRTVTMGGGYFGGTDDETGGDCERQHMVPGLADRGDVGSGIGTALYIAGNMVVAAAVESGRGFPYRNLVDANEACTFSVHGDRSEAASRAWENMVRHGLAEEEGEEGGEYVEEEYDADSHAEIDESSVMESFSSEYPRGEIEGMSLSGTVYVSGYAGGQLVNTMNWDHIRNTGLILHLGRFFEDPSDLVVVPPEVFARADWKNTTDDQLVMYAKNIHDSLGRTPDAKAWVREAACHFGTGSPKSNMLLDLIGEGPQLALPGVAMNQRACPTRFRPEARRWLERFGPDTFTEPNPRRKRRTRSKTAPRPHKKVLKNKLLRETNVRRLKNKLMR